MRNRFGVVVFLLGAASLALVGCGGDNSVSSSAPQFSGPYAAEFQDLYDHTDSDFVKEVLSDGVITEAELEETKNRVAECLLENGATDVKDQGDGGEIAIAFDVGRTQEEELAIVSKCQEAEATIFGLYNQISTNPENVDLTDKQYQCLIAFGFVDPSVTADDFRAAEEKDGNQALMDKYENDQEATSQITDCFNDPLHQDY